MESATPIKAKQTKSFVGYPYISCQGEGKMFLNKIKEFSYEKYEGVGLGSNIRATKSGFVLGGLYYRNKVIHLSRVQG